jgi:hypothetical protein
VQNEGLGVYVLIDRFVPGWQRTLTERQLTSPVTLLVTAVAP